MRRPSPRARPGTPAARGPRLGDPLRSPPRAPSPAGAWGRTPRAGLGRRGLAASPWPWRAPPGAPAPARAPARPGVAGSSGPRASPPAGRVSAPGCPRRQTKTVGRGSDPRGLARGGGVAVLTGRAQGLSEASAAPGTHCDDAAAAHQPLWAGTWAAGPQDRVRGRPGWAGASA